MAYKVTHPTKSISGTIHLPSSKSESNRILMIKAISGLDIDIHNLAPAKDTVALFDILARVKATPSPTGDAETFNVGHAGTTMRFLTAYFSCIEGERILTGSDRMLERPIGELVEALRALGADIQYMGEKGYPPLKIIGGDMHGGEVGIKGSVSSQFISALLMVSPLMKRGLVLNFTDELVSRPYVNMTLHIMEQYGVYGVWEHDSIHVSHQQYSLDGDENKNYYVSGDWSSASYLYSIAALAQQTSLDIEGLKENSLQGDSILKDIFNFFGVKNEWSDKGLHLTRSAVLAEQFHFDFEDCPDTAQTMAVLVSALRIPSIFTGVRTLRVKETDRISALKNELEKFDVVVEVISDNEIKIDPTNFNARPVSIYTYNDHRMALCFAPLALVCESITIEHPEVVEKSYPNYWDDLKKMGFVIEEV